MKKLLLWVVIYLVGVVSGVVINWTTSGAKDRGRIAALESEVSGKTSEVGQCRNALEKCASALSPSAPAVPQQK
ncbi:MAG TPA: hypothetical protein VFJ47_00570 [Terriglobales bacterium]|nr:hypothetical protein [Terriglobales bacterium]